MDSGGGINLPDWAQLLATILVSIFAAGAGIWGFLSKRNESPRRLLGGSDCTSCTFLSACRDPRKGLGYICNSYQSDENDALLKKIVENGDKYLVFMKEFLEGNQELVVGVQEIARSNLEMLKILREELDAENFERALKVRLENELPRAVATFIEDHKKDKE